MKSTCKMVHKQDVHIEVVLRPTSHISPSRVSAWLEKRLSSAVSVFQNGPLPPSCYAATGDGDGDGDGDKDDTALHISSSILRITVVDLLPNTSVSFWQTQLHIHAYAEYDTAPDKDFLDCEGDADSLPAFEQWDLPNTGLQGLWESIVVDPHIKAKLLGYCDTSECMR